jgi:hypothetical protein
VSACSGCLVELGTSAAAATTTVSERHAAMTEFAGARRLLAAAGNNLNQVARVANSTGRVPSDGPAVVAAVARVLGRLDRALDRLSVARP